MVAVGVLRARRISRTSNNAQEKETKNQRRGQVSRGVLEKKWLPCCLRWLMFKVRRQRNEVIDVLMSPGQVYESPMIGWKGKARAYLHIPSLIGVYCRPEVTVYTSEFQSTDKKITPKAMLRSQSRSHSSLEWFIKNVFIWKLSFRDFLFHSCITFDYSIGFRKTKLSLIPTNTFSYHNWDLVFLEKCFKRLMFLKCNFVVLPLSKLS